MFRGFPLVLVAVLSLAEGRYLEEFDSCGDGGTCRNITQCSTALSGLRVGHTPEICSFVEMTAIVCCLPEAKMMEQLVTTTTQRPVNTKKGISEKMCEEYSKYVYAQGPRPLLHSVSRGENECGWPPQALILGGQDAKLKEFPHMAHIGYGPQKRAEYFCGGSLISERWVLSAAHCTQPTNVGLAKWVRLGSLNTKKDMFDGVETFGIVERINHPEYNPPKLYNDISLYKLDRDVELTPFIRPICLQVDHDIERKFVLASGWGHTSWGGHPSKILQKVNLTVVNTADCVKPYSSFVGHDKLPNSLDDSTMMCAGGEKGKDSCQGDSGGPIQTYRVTPYCMYSIVGITSFGRSCGEFPGVYTRVSAFVPWIEQIVWPGKS